VLTAQDLCTKLTHLLRDSLSQPNLEIDALIPLSGGASRQSWGCRVRWLNHDRRLVVRLGEKSLLGQSLIGEAKIMRAARSCGVPVPRVIAVTHDRRDLGVPFLVMEWEPGRTSPKYVLGDGELASVRPHLAVECGRILAQIHSISPAAVTHLSSEDPLVLLRRAHADTGEPLTPIFALALNVLNEHRPPPLPPRPIHGDFRLGNLLIDHHGIRSVLDWEMARLGDPLQDLGWMCVRAWRYGRQMPVGGFGSYANLLRGYAEAGGVTVDSDALAWWEAYGCLLWGVLTRTQYALYRTGQRLEIEYVAIGCRTPEAEWDILNAIRRWI
jgi:aminoglycoside phosphotransferase (APT) family kinase protein